MLICVRWLAPDQQFVGALTRSRLEGRCFRIRLITTTRIRPNRSRLLPTLPITFLVKESGETLQRNVTSRRQGGGLFLCVGRWGQPPGRLAAHATLEF